MPCGWNIAGSVYDCDFNQQLDMGIRSRAKKGGLTVHDIECTDDLTRNIAMAAHCFACTAGMGSS